MKTIVVLAVSIVLVGILFCPMVMSAPSSMPADLQIVQPDPSLPKELSAFFGKYGFTEANFEIFVIVEKINEEKASVYIWRSGSWPPGTTLGWSRIEAKVIKENGKYKFWFMGPFGKAEYTLRGEDLVVSTPSSTSLLKRVP